MKKITYLFLISIFFLSCNNEEKQQANEETQHANEENESKSTISENADQLVNSKIDAWVGFWASYDLNEIDALFSDQITYFSSETKGLMKGKDVIIEHHKGFGFVPGGKTVERSLWVEETNVKFLGDVAEVSAIWFFGDKAAPKDSVQQGPVTFLLAPEGDQYKITHAHFANY